MIKKLIPEEKYILDTRITEKLEKLGFQVPFVYRMGPCDNCVSTSKKTFYNPVSKKWLCEVCFYHA
jgi:hypothetical protein